MKSYYHDILHAVRSGATSTDDAMTEVEDLIDRINEIRNAAIDCIDYGETDALDFAVWRSRAFVEDDEEE